MKLRIQDNSIRLRLTRSEVEKLAADERVAGSIQFTAAPDDTLAYAVETSSSCAEVRAERTANEIRVTLPRNLARTWATTDLVTIERLQPVGLGALQILVEKDFRCAHRDAASQEGNAADLYPNPTDAVRSLD